MFKEYKAVAEIIKQIDIMRSSCGCSESGANEFKKALVNELVNHYEKKSKISYKYNKNRDSVLLFNKKQFKELCGVLE